MDEKKERKLPRERFNKKNTRKKPVWFVVTKQFSSDLKVMLDNSMLGYATLLKSHYAPVSMTPSELSQIIHGRRKKIKRHHADFLLELMQKRQQISKQIPRSKTYRESKVEISSGYIFLLKSEIKRTGLNPVKLFSKPVSVPPDDLEAKTVSAWQYGRKKFARQCHLRWVMNEYKNHPTRPSRSPKMQVITEEELILLKNEIKRTGINPDMFIRIARLNPGIRAHTIKGWLRGDVSKAHPKKLEWVVQGYKSLPDDYMHIARKAFPAKKPKSKTTRAISSTISQISLATIKQEILRTGMLPDMMIKSLPQEERMAGVSGNSVLCWLEGKSTSTLPHKVQWVIDQYQRLPSITP